MTDLGRKSRSLPLVHERGMRAGRKLDEAKYFLKVLRQLEKTGYVWKPARREAFHHNLSAFIVAWRSVVDVMLFDFAELYSLGFDPRDRITDSTFEVAAKALRHHEALKFLAWWRQKIRRLKKNPLYRRRDMIVHRGTPPATYVTALPDNFIDDMGLGDGVDFAVLEPRSGPVMLIVAPSGGLSHDYLEERLKRIEEGKDEPTEETGVTKEIKEIKLSVSHELEDFSERPITDVCQNVLRQMEQLVETAEKDFWAKQPEIHERVRLTQIRRDRILSKHAD